MLSATTAAKLLFRRAFQAPVPKRSLITLVK